MEVIIEDLQNEIAQLENFKNSEIQTMGFVCGRTFNKLANRKRKLAELKMKTL